MLLAIKPLLQTILEGILLSEEKEEHTKETVGRKIDTYMSVIKQNNYKKLSNIMKSK